MYCRTRREDLGLSCKLLAERVGVEASYVSSIEGDHRVPSSPTLARLARALQCDLRELVARAVRLDVRTMRYLRRRPDAVRLIERLVALDVGEAEIERLLDTVK